ncbi:unnamed protein product [Brassica rapa subsp. trilocularis]
MQVGWRLSWSGIIPVPDSLVGCSGILHSFFFLWGLKFNLVVPPFQPVLLLGRCDSSLSPTYRFCVEECSE